MIGEVVSKISGSIRFSGKEKCFLQLLF